MCDLLYHSEKFLQQFLTNFFEKFLIFSTKICFEKNFCDNAVFLQNQK